MNQKHQLAAIIGLIIFCTLTGCNMPQADTVEAFPVETIAENASDSNFDKDDVIYLFSQGRQELVWLVDDSVFDSSEDVTVWYICSTNHGTLWTTLYETAFPDAAIVQEEPYAEGKWITLSNGVAAWVCIGNLQFRITDKELFSATFSQSLGETILAALPYCIEMELQLYEESSNEKSYAFYLNGLPLDTGGYGIQDDVIPGAKYSVYNDDEETVIFYIPYLPTAEAEVLSHTEFIPVETIKAICKADLIAQYEGAAILILENAMLTYSFQPDTQQLTPAWRITGQIYRGSDWGYMKTSLLINAITGELHHGN